MPSLADLTPRKPSTTLPPQLAKDEATGLQVAWEVCVKCGASFMVTKSPRLCNSSGGECVCVIREREARKILETRGEEIRKRVEERKQATAKERKARANAEGQRMLDAELPLIEKRLDWEDQQRFQAEESEAMLARIVAELKAKET